jgi:hypothetical protein
LIIYILVSNIKSDNGADLTVAEPVLFNKGIALLRKPMLWKTLLQMT